MIEGGRNDMSERHTFNGTCIHAEDEVCPHYEESINLVLSFTARVKKLEADLEFYRALHNAEAFNRLAAAAQEKLDEYVEKYKKIREANNAVQ